MLAALEVPVWQLRAPAIDDLQAASANEPIIAQQSASSSNSPSTTDPVIPGYQNSDQQLAANQKSEQRVLPGELLSWEGLQQRVANCRACELHHDRQQPVLGQGSQAADWLIVGGAPGSAEESAAEPFSGRAGQLLTNMMLALGLSLEQIYLTNIVKCRPANDRDPSRSEREQCMAHLQHQVALVKPKIILLMGASAAHAVLNNDESVAALRGRDLVFDNSAIPVVVTQYPADLLTMADQKSQAWDDLCFALRRYNGSLLLE